MCEAEEGGIGFYECSPVKADVRHRAHLLQAEETYPPALPPIIPPFCTQALDPLCRERPPGIHC